ncbi:hypothetical protein AJ88_05155 [Mesorhizobium amorphae CCBAU 01583]|nr:hypothetical protein AJ88_05155 [Mesorhizobium amorphae CCBAU 01583]
MPRIGRQAFDIAALAFGIDGVEGKRRLAGPRQAGHDDQAVTRQVEIDILQIVFARPANGKVFMVGHRRSPPQVWNSWDRRVFPAIPYVGIFAATSRDATNLDRSL